MILVEDPAAKDSFLAAAAEEIHELRETQASKYQSLKKYGPGQRRASGWRGYFVNYGSTLGNGEEDEETDGGEMRVGSAKGHKALVSVALLGSVVCFAFWFYARQFGGVLATASPLE